MSRLTFFCDLAEATTPLPHFWEHTVGSDHASMALRDDWQRDLKRAHDELGFRYVRFHGLLSDDIGIVDVDRVFDFLFSIGMRPFVELSFMPAALASGNKTVFHYKANVTPPKNYKTWARLIEQLVVHLVERYGEHEVSEWLFEVWNEPNLKAFWRGTQRDYFRLYRHTAEAIKKISASFKVGGPATAKSEWIEDFVDYCERNDVAADFVSTHHYPNDGFAGKTEVQLFKSQRGIMREVAQNTRAHARGRPVYYTEWNTSSNPFDELHDEPYAAAAAASTLMEANGLVEGYSFWTFSDIFEEHGLPSMPFHGGFGLLTLHGIPKPTYRTFELLHDLGEQQSLVDGLHETVDCSVVQKESSVTLLLTNHTTPGHSIETEEIHIRLTNAREPVAARIQRVDQDHVNPKRLWEEMGRPESLSQKDIDQLEAASVLVSEKQPLEFQDGSVFLKTNLPAHGVAAITIDFSPQR
ncbi:MAG TPA: glycosyl hydrolase [Pyrinomonadaceae bacterium]|nr:glycosyl hydrolase [Pyrinomonadaceae bacterium]